MGRRPLSERQEGGASGSFLGLTVRIAIHDARALGIR